MSSSCITGRKSSSRPQMTVFAGEFSQAISTRWGQLSSKGGTSRPFRTSSTPGRSRPDRQHAAGSRDALLKDGAMMNQTRRVGERESTGSICCRHLAGTVAHHAIRIDTPRLEQLHQGALEHENYGLGQLAFVKPRLRHLETCIAQRRRFMRTPVRVNGINDPAKDRMRLVERTAAAGPLCALAGKHHCQAPFSFLGNGDGRRLLLECFQRRCKIGHCPCNECRPHGEMCPATTQVAGERVEVNRLIIQNFAQPPRALDQGILRSCRKRHHVAGPLAPAAPTIVWERLAGIRAPRSARWLLQNQRN